jgi:carbon starvation protein
LWGYFLYQGVIDPSGRHLDAVAAVRHANQMLAAIALILCTVVLFKMKRQRFAWVTIVPATWLVLCTVTAGLEKVFNPNPAVGFIGFFIASGRPVPSAGDRRNRGSHRRHRIIN